jgi:hypothetical protein
MEKKNRFDLRCPDYVKNTRAYEDLLYAMDQMEKKRKLIDALEIITEASTMYKKTDQLLAMLECEAIKIYILNDLSYLKWIGLPGRNDTPRHLIAEMDI